ncbi:type IV secretion system DNA-binding domain-containing protein [Stieleria sp. ICT_E10.1]|uniref:type IV secretion system DNA-binding domain-containing protein n=1 Tax=Stieleria sedimenti TaxID=2976331 RepID=UPI00217F84D3|nr:type IV secretion system DNA-binding domain-containing protein [Stieleria sedimenti]MCS7466279.1 type IV secretion system DNA-binding domain-containing protein [Stieleria sedimenti]
MNLGSKPDHPALDLFNSSLHWKDQYGEEVVARDFLREVVFPMPGAETNIVDMAPHTAIVGSTGSGKTILLKHFMRSLLSAPYEEGGLQFRAVVYDPKRELFPFLRMMQIPESQIIVTHPFDSRSASWDIAADFTEPAQIEELAELIVPKAENPIHGEGAHFFDNSARIIVQDVIEVFHHIRPRLWELRDVVEVLVNLDYLRAVLAKTSSGRDTWTAYLEPLDRDRGDRTGNSILATLHSYARPFQSLASLWHRAERKFSLDQWHVGSGILLLGADPRRERTLQRINRLLLRRISQLVLGRGDERPIDLTWFFLDEIREAGKLHGLRQLMTEGRSKGARVVLGFQDIEGLYSLYGEHEAGEMVGLCANQLLLHIDNPKTRTWASDFMGEAEIPDVSKTESETQSRDGPTWSRSMQLSVGMRPNVLPVEFHKLPLGNPFRGVPAWFAVPGTRNKAILDSEAAKEAVFFEESCEAEAFSARPSADQQRCVWGAEDLQRFDLNTKPSVKDPEDTTGRPGLRLGSLEGELIDLDADDEFDGDSDDEEIL